MTQLEDEPKLIIKAAMTKKKKLLFHILPHFFYCLYFILSISKGKFYDQKKKMKALSVRVALQKTAINPLQNLISSGGITSQLFSLYMSFSDVLLCADQADSIAHPHRFLHCCSAKRNQKLCSVKAFYEYLNCYFDSFRFYSSPYIFLYFATLKRDKSCQQSNKNFQSCILHH